MVRGVFCCLRRTDALGFATVRRADLNVRFLRRRGSARTNRREEKRRELIISGAKNLINPAEALRQIMVCRLLL